MKQFEATIFEMNIIKIENIMEVRDLMDVTMIMKEPRVLKSLFVDKNTVQVTVFHCFYHL